MAILNRLSCIPLEDECETLSGIKGTFEIWRQKLLFPEDVVQEFYLVDMDSRIAICICSDYWDVKFKFECLYLTVSQKLADESAFGGERIIDSIKDFQQAKAVFRAEWESPALPSGLSSNNEHVVQVRGELNDVPDDVSACVSMVGVLLVGADGESQGLVYLDDDFPLLLSYIEDPKAIEKFISQSSVVEIDDIAEIRNQQ
jgi:hypothetical protein